mmetsp:Transcript_157010/g.277164  ORF Transcript_157010/g.277164 Transcript_157010/m.277164 type:complete len:706 (-) Transcript_157010:17-2134(-)
MSRYTLHAPVKYFSASYNQWIDCHVVELAPSGEVQVSCKPGYWVSLVEQEQKMRAGTAVAAAPAAAGYPAAGGQPPMAPPGGQVQRRVSRSKTGVQTQPTPEQMKKIRQILDSREATGQWALQQFGRFDLNADGLLQPSELETCLKTLHAELGIPAVSSTQIQMLISKFDSDGNGAFDLKEFEEFFNRVLIKSRQSFEQWKVHCEFFVEKQVGDPFQVYEVQKKLGEGTFGVTHLVQDRRSRQTRVLKTVNKAKSNMPPAEMEVEIKTLRMLDHPHIIKLFEYYEDSVNIYLAMEQAQGGELLQIIEELYNEGWRVSERWSATVMQQVLEAIVYCHSKKLIHKDLKAENIMLLRTADSKTHPHAVVIDLGLAEMFGSTSGDPRGQSMVLRGRGDEKEAVEDRLYRRIQSRKVGGTPATMAPEVWRAYMGQGSFGMKCDVYSLGVVLFQLLTGGLPFCATTLDPPLWISLIERGPRMDMLAACSPEARDLVCWMLVPDPARRPKCREALGHAWFSVKAHQVDAKLSEAQMLALKTFGERNELQKAVILQVASQLRAADLPKINAIFRKYDAGNTGFLEGEELVKALMEVGCDEETAQRSTKAVDLDQNGKIEYTEFVAACISLFDDRHEAYLWQIFKKLDKDGSGMLASQEIAELLLASERNGLGCAPSRSEIQAILEHMDTDKNGSIRFEEFCNYFNPHRARSRG